jgi:hypothetical protein
VKGVIKKFWVFYPWAASRKGGLPLKPCSRPSGVSFCSLI